MLWFHELVGLSSGRDYQRGEHGETTTTRNDGMQNGEEEEHNVLFALGRVKLQEAAVNASGCLLRDAWRLDELHVP